MPLDPQPLAAPQHFAVVGAGLIGRLMAWQLLAQGHKVTLFERGDTSASSSAARVAAAMLAPYSELVSSEESIFHWGLESLSLWPALLAQLAEHSQTAVELQQQGSVVVAHAGDQTSLQHVYQQLQRKLVTSPEHWRAVARWQHDEIVAMEPALAEHFASALFFADEGCLDNTALLAALTEAINTLGANWRCHTEVQAVLPNQVVMADGRESFDTVIDCRGVGACASDTSLRAVRGEVLWVKAAEVNFSRPIRLMHPRYQLYIAPKPDSVYVIGATEIESDSMAPITIRSTLELSSALYSVHRGFAEAQLLHALAHCRPAYRDNLPKIHSRPGLISLNGLYRHGFLLAPVMLQQTLALLREPSYSHPMIAVNTDQHSKQHAVTGG